MEGWSGLVLCVAILNTVDYSLEVSSCSKKNIYYVSVNGSSSFSNCKPNDLNSPCGSLSSLVSTVHECAEFVLLDNPYILSDVVRFYDNSNVTLKGIEENLVIECQGNVGLVYQSCVSCSLSSVQFVGCQADFTQYLNPPGLIDRLSFNVSTILMMETSYVRISNCTFHSDAGPAILLVNLHESTIIEGSAFLGSSEKAANNRNLRSGGVVMRHTAGHNYNNSISVLSCLFDSNWNIDSNCNNYTELNMYGGAIDIVLVAENAALHVLISGSNFSHNSACVGGAVRILQYGKNFRLNAVITDSLFYNNHAYYGGGALAFAFFNYSSDSVGLDTYGEYFVQKCVFQSNSAMWAGAIAAYISKCKHHCRSEIKITVVDGLFEHNSASQSGFAVGLSSDHYKDTTEKYVIEIIISGNCTFRDHRYHDHDDDNEAIGVISIQYAKITFGNGTTIIESNVGTALLLRDLSCAKFVGNVLFKNNTGVLGGAVLVQSKSSVFIATSSVIDFVGNKALVYGGAFYSSVVDEYNCVIQIESSEPSKLRVHFYSNMVHSLDQSVFIRTSKPCESQKDLILHGFKMSPPGPFQVVFPPDSVNFEILTAAGKEERVELMLGEPFYVKPISIKDIFHTDSTGIGYMYYEQLDVTDEPLIILGPRTVNFDDFTANISFSVVGPEIINETNMSISFFFEKQSNYHIGSNTADVTVVPCRLGYTYSGDKCVCISSDKVKCMQDIRKVCLKYHYWFSNESKSVYPCPGVNCEYRHGRCPSRSHNCSVFDDYCSIVKSDDVCWKGRTGILCSECVEGYSFTLGAFKCVDSNDTCSAKSTVILVVVLMLYWSLYAVAILVILSLRLSMGSGFMYGIVYYFSVVAIYTQESVVFGDEWVEWLLAICEALSQLNCFKLFARIVPYCFARNWSTTLPHILFQYVGPIFVISLISLTIVCSRHCRLPKRFHLNRLSPIHAMCMLILFSYTSLSITSFQLLLPLKIDGRYKVKAAPTISYLSPNHIPYALTAILVELIVSLPICFLLLFAPCLSKRVDLVKYKLKPIVDEFQACYRPKFRWFAGFYFLARQLVYLTNGFFSETEPQGNALLVLLNVLIWTIHTLSQPYQKKWLNVLDTFLLTDLVLLSSALLDPSSSDLEVPVNIYLHTKIVPYALLIFPSCYLVGSFIVVFVQKVNLKRLCVDKLFLKFSAFRLKSGVAKREREVSRSQDQGKWDDSYYRDDGLREPLLEETSDVAADVRSRSSGNSSKVTYGSVERYHGASETISSSNSARNSQMNLFPPH